MFELLNRYGRKTARRRILRALDGDVNMGGEGNLGGGGGGGSGADSGQSNGADDGSGGNGQGQKQRTDDDLNLEDLMKDAEDEPLQIGDDDLNQGLDQVTEEEKQANIALGQSIQREIQNWSFSEADIPEDMDWNDRKSVAQFVTKTNQAAVAKSVQTIAPIITHALKTVVGKLEARIDRSVNKTSKIGEAEKVFNDLGFTNEDRVLARQLYNRGLKSKMTPQQAAKATNNAMRSMGKSGNVQSNTNRGNGRGNQSSELKIGSDALDSMFS